MWYIQADLFKNGVKKTHRVHRLVWATYIENKDNLPVINHIDWDKMNNHVSNLEWCTTLENARKAWAMGLYGKKEKTQKQIDWYKSAWILRSRKVSQFTKEWFFICTFPSCEEARKATWASNISRCANWVLETSWKFKWQYAE